MRKLTRIRGVIESGWYGAKLEFGSIRKLDKLLKVDSINFETNSSILRVELM